MSAVNGLLAGKVGLVTGIANERSVAAGCAHAFHEAGAELVLTCREKSKSFVMPVAKAIKPRLLLPLDVEIDGALESVFDQIQSTFGRLDFVLHSIAFLPEAGFSRPCNGLLTRGLRPCNGCLGAFVHSHGAIGRTTDAEPPPGSTISTS
jgi:enoyl-[acyl-carrier-protein] reductase (NADH)